MFQFSCTLDKDSPKPDFPKDGCIGDLSISIYQRSADFFLGVPFNIASYSFLLYMIASLTNMRPGLMYYNFGDAHVYLNHVDQCRQQMGRPTFALPSLTVKPRTSIDDFVFDDFVIEEYRCHPAIKAPVSV
jgi:thymidylate synthase